MIFEDKDRAAFYHTETGGRPYHQYTELANIWHPRCSKCKEGCVKTM
jgi:hypothetical protein